MMKDSILVKTDGWYIDLPKFNCPVRYTPPRIEKPAEKNQPECRDRFVTRRSGKGKLGFPLIETTTMQMGGEQSKSMEFKTDLETLDFSMEKLDSMLFEIPPGYTETKNEEDLQDKMEMSGMIDDIMNKAKKQIKEKPVTEEKEAGMLRIGILPPKADEQVSINELQSRLVTALQSGKIETVAVANEEEAKTMKCDYLLSSELSKIKSGSKVGGLIKAIKNTDPNALSTFSIEGNMQLTKLADGSPAGQQKIDGKFEGKVNDAAGKALENSGTKIVSKLE
jgi:predicted house-cleaning noncanonical NTP pyrophosphatase (MazG superfamily)